MINILYLRVIVYFRGQVSRPLYAVVAVVLLCGPLPLDRVLDACQSHATWVDRIRKAWFLLHSAAEIISGDPMAECNGKGRNENVEKKGC